MSHTLRFAMKTTLSFCLALVAFAPAHAQVFRSEAVNGAILGGIAGGIIGHNSGDLRHNGWKGAAIGSAAGLLIGQAIGDSRAHREYARTGYPHGGYVYRSAPSVHVGIGYSRGYHGGYRHGWHGGHFGHYGHHRGWGHRDYWHLSYRPSFGYYRGYGWGYPHVGYRDYADYVYAVPSAPVIVQQPQPVVQAAPVQQTQAPQQVTIINNYYNSSTPMSSANGLFGR